MPIPPELRAERIAETTEMAAALVEDLTHMRELTSKIDPNRGELRRLSGTLSRLLIERDLSNVAAPRTERVTIRCPNNQEFYRHTRKHNLPLFCSGGGTAFGIQQRGMMVNEGRRPIDVPNLDMDAMVDLRIDNFLRQDILCLHGDWANRQDVILYIRHIGFGVHSGTPRQSQERKFAIVQNVKNCVSLGKTKMPGSDEYAASISINMDAIAMRQREFRYDPEGIDPVLFELLCMAEFICNSPDVHNLETVIRQELR